MGRPHLGVLYLENGSSQGGQWYPDYALAGAPIAVTGFVDPTDRAEVEQVLKAGVNGIGVDAVLAQLSSLIRVRTGRRRRRRGQHDLAGQRRGGQVVKPPHRNTHGFLLSPALAQP